MRACFRGGLMLLDPDLTDLSSRAAEEVKGELFQKKYVYEKYYSERMDGVADQGD